MTFAVPGSTRNHRIAVGDAGLLRCLWNAIQIGAESNHGLARAPRREPRRRYAGNAALYGRNPLNPDAKADYFDSLYHSHAVVGLVTSAFLEAAIVGRPVHTLLLPELAK